MSLRQALPSEAAEEAAAAFTIRGRSVGVRHGVGNLVRRVQQCRGGAVGCEQLFIVFVIAAIFCKSENRIHGAQVAVAHQRQVEVPLLIKELLRGHCHPRDSGHSFFAIVIVMFR
jgi:hypothetical protein